MLNITLVDHPRIKAVATINIEELGKISGIKVILGNKNFYCVPPNFSYKENGLRKWMNVITFDQNLWSTIQKRILKRYEDLENEKERSN